MNIDQYADNPTRSFSRKKQTYEEAGISPEFSIVVPFNPEDTRESIENKGVSWPDFIRFANSAYTTAIGVIFEAKIKKALADETKLPGQSELDDIVASFDFSPRRGVSSLAQSLEERTFVSLLSARLRKYLRDGVFSADSESPIKVQSQKDAKEKKIPEKGKIALATFEALVQAAISGGEVKIQDRVYDFSGEPEFVRDDSGGIVSYENLAALVAHCREIAHRKFKAEQELSSIKAAN